MENKYYTPTIEEFHVGFEYEEQFVETNKGIRNFIWDKEIYNLDHSLEVNFDGEYNFTLLEDINDGNIRVKYLDREDIESLGFVLGYYSDEEDRSLFRLKDDRTLSYGWSDKILWITNQGVNFTCFRGIIKNKSELKQLLGWLKV